MKRKILNCAAVGLLLVSLLFGTAACGSSGQQPSAGGNGSTQGSADKPTLVVVNWKDYGSDNPEAVQKFESENNCKIVHEYMASEEELLTKLRTGGVGKLDVVLPNPQILPTAIKEGLLEELDTSKLSNYPNVYDKFKKLPESSMGGKTYAVPWVWGSTGIAYNTKLIKEDINSVNVLWDQKYKGFIGFRDDFNDAVMTAAIALGQDPNNPSDLNAIKNKLKEQKPLNKTYWKTGDEWSKFFANEQITVGLMWSGQSASMKKAGQPIKYVVPKEGAIGWVDYWAVVKNAPHKDLAVKFVDYMISEGFQKDWVSKGGPAPVNKVVADSLSEDFKKDAGITEDILNRLYFISYHDEEVKKAWNELWQEVKAE
ncbi:MAG: ABC transporter substrate-binding protein [Clostridiales bacterium]|jgi:spermidine/putrescine transport system substrate-binding protein|nr:ABC transporter substrate-binding protein [Eubacteriales bacterium]MDH7565692.1 ABC transporter substrate-binding protein [Clostridiales bacterium]